MTAPTLASARTSSAKRIWYREMTSSPSSPSIASTISWRLVVSILFSRVCKACLRSGAISGYRANICPSFCSVGVRATKASSRSPRLASAGSRGRPPRGRGERSPPTPRRERLCGLPVLGCAGRLSQCHDAIARRWFLPGEKRAEEGERGELRIIILIMLQGSGKLNLGVGEIGRKREAEKERERDGSPEPSDNGFCVQAKRWERLLDNEGRRLGP